MKIFCEYMFSIICSGEPNLWRTVITIHNNNSQEQDNQVKKDILELLEIKKRLESEQSKALTLKLFAEKAGEREEFDYWESIESILTQILSSKQQIPNSDKQSLEGVK